MQCPLVVDVNCAKAFFRIAVVPGYQGDQTEVVAKADPIIRTLNRRYHGVSHYHFEALAPSVFIPRMYPITLFFLYHKVFARMRLPGYGASNLCERKVTFPPRSLFRGHSGSFQGMHIISVPGYRVPG